MIPGIASSERRMKSSVQPTIRPSRCTGSQLVIPCSTPSGPTASSSATSGSRASSIPPSVKPISGSAFSDTHFSDRSTIWLAIPSDSSGQLVQTGSMPSLIARVSG